MALLEPCSNTLPDLVDIYSKKKKKNIKEKCVYQFNTKNTSFIKMYNILKMLGVKNNKFFLKLYDKHLMNVNPYEPFLSLETKIRIIRECKKNFWYFARECVRIPVAGAAVGEGKLYELHRGNLAMNFCCLNNLNSFTELPRQNYKSVSMDVLLLWLFNYGTTNSSMIMLNKEHKDAKDNLSRIKEIREVLPEYLKCNKDFNKEGKSIKPDENVESAFNKKSRNRIITKASAMSKEKADLLGRGMTTPIQWIDEFGFLKHNLIIYDSASPATSKASEEAERYGKPHFKSITTTPGDLETEQGKGAYEFINDSAKFHDSLYDKSIKYIQNYINKNSKTLFLHIKYSYKQLGRSQEYFDKQVGELRHNWSKIRREVLLQWNKNAVDSPFSETDLEELGTYSRENIKEININKYYYLNLYEYIGLEYPIIIGVDVATGHSRDSSVVVLIDSKTKRIVGEFISNTINPTDLSSLIYTIAKEIAPNCVICIERNHAGEAVISNIQKTDVRNKLYYEYKKSSKIDERMKNGIITNDLGNDNKVYGIYTVEQNRDKMMDILCDTVKFYKSRISIKPFYEQVKSLQYIKGRIDHPSSGHDDLVMAYLIAMYAYYHGTNMQRFGVIKFPDIKDDEDINSVIPKSEEEDKKLQQPLINMSLAYEDNNRAIINSGNKSIKELHDKNNLEIQNLSSYDNSVITGGHNIANSNTIASVDINLFKGDYDDEESFGRQLFKDIL